MDSLFWKTKLAGVTILKADNSHVSNLTHLTSGEDAPGGITARQKNRKGVMHMCALEITYQKVKSDDSGPALLCSLYVIHKGANQCPMKTTSEPSERTWSAEIGLHCWLDGIWNHLGDLACGHAQRVLADVGRPAQKVGSTIPCTWVPN